MLLSLLALVSCIAASRLGIPDNDTPANTGNTGNTGNTKVITEQLAASRLIIPDNDTPANTGNTGNTGNTKVITEQLAALNLSGFEGTLAKGTSLWIETLGDDMKYIVMVLDDKIKDLTNCSNDFSSAAVLLHGFLEASDKNYDHVVHSMVKTAIALRKLNLLRTLATLYVWSSPEQFHWFQALGYKSTWYDPIAWNDNPVPMNWHKHLYTASVAGNPALVNDILTGKLPLKHRLNIDTDTMLHLISTHDLLEIYLSQKFKSRNPIKARLKILAESGSFKILRYLVNTEAMELHLENYPFPKALPEDFEFFWMQGYRYLPPSHFIGMACEHGRVDILNYFHDQINTILIPDKDHLVLAATNGHSIVLEWALDKCLPMDSAKIVLEMVSNGHFKAFEQLEKRFRLSTTDVQLVLNTSVEQKRLDIIKWIHGRFNILPESHALGDASIKMLEWIGSVNPQIINEELAENANLDNLKWLSRNHSYLFNYNVRSAHNNKLVSFEKIQWMTSQGWKPIPDMSHAARKGKVRTLEAAYKLFQTGPTLEHAILAAQNGHTKVLELIYSIDPSCINDDTLLDAVKHNHLKAAMYLKQIVIYRGRELDYNLKMAFGAGNVELIEWVNHNRWFFLSRDSWLQESIKNGQLNTINWAIQMRDVRKDAGGFLTTAAQWGQHLIFQRLVDYGVYFSSEPEYLLAAQMAFQSGSLEMVKYFVKEKPRTIECLKTEKATINNHHIWLWLRDQSFQNECCIF